MRVNMTVGIVEPVKKTLDNLEVGDILYFDGYKYKVLAVLGGVIGLSNDDEHDVFGGWYTVQELKEDKYTIDSDPEEMTVAQVCEALGKTIKIVK